MGAVGADAFDGDNLVSRGGGECRDAGANCVAVHVNGARPTGADAAAELGAGQAEDVTECPQERHLGIARNVALKAIDPNLRHREFSLIGAPPLRLVVQLRRTG